MPRAPRPPALALAAVLLAGAAAGCTSAPTASEPSPPGQASASASHVPLRTLPRTAECGGTFEVRIAVQPPPGTVSWLLEEFLPPGWGAFEPTGAFASPTASGVKFTAPGDRPAALAYMVTIPGGASGAHPLGGDHRFHPAMASRAATGGDAELSVACA